MDHRSSHLTALSDRAAPSFIFKLIKYPKKTEQLCLLSVRMLTAIQKGKPAV